MSEFKDKAMETVEEASEKAKEAFDTAADVARDKFDTFKKLKPQQQKIILGVLGVVVLAVVAWIVWPNRINVTLEMQIVEVTVGNLDIANSVVIMNDEEEDLGETTIKLDNIYEAYLDSVPPGETIAIKVTEFRKGGDENGKAPDPNFVPMRITVECDMGIASRKYSKSKK